MTTAALPAAEPRRELESLTAAAERRLLLRMAARASRARIERTGPITSAS